MSSGFVVTHARDAHFEIAVGQAQAVGVNDLLPGAARNALVQQIADREWVPHAMASLRPKCPSRPTVHPRAFGLQRSHGLAAEVIGRRILLRCPNGAR